MMETVLDDTHLCIKCSATIDGLDNYIQHRRLVNCTGSQQKANQPAISDASVVSSLSHTYDSFAFPSPVTTSYARKSEERSKISKSSLNDCYDLAYELGADVFFSSLQLQSVQATSATSPSKAENHTATQLQRSKSQTENGVWISHATSDDNTLAVVNDISEAKKPFDVIFQPIGFASEGLHESPDGSDDDDDDEEVDVEVHDTVYENSVPAHHTGGKWKPGASQSQQAPTNCWDEPDAEPDVNAGEHPPAGHTKGKWIPGSKVQRLEYKIDVPLVQASTKKNYWCNICCRNLKSKNIYENHLHTSYHLKRAETERQLERAAIDEHRPAAKITPEQLTDMATESARESNVPSGGDGDGKRKRRRQTALIKCELCKYVMYRHFIGKHLISHYHYRHMQAQPHAGSLQMILDNMHAIVLQSPFQCRPCRFYANTSDTFLQHWTSAAHEQGSRGAGNFWCSYCYYECCSNDEMLAHLLSDGHKEVVLAINRSVPICISKKLSIDCEECGTTGFRYNMQLRQHMVRCHPLVPLTAGSASNGYQGREQCQRCHAYFHTKVALQRHEKNKHSILKYFCSICKLDFETALEARRHRKTFAHRQQALAAQSPPAQKKPSKVLRTARQCAASGKRRSELCKCKDCAVVCRSLDDLRTHRNAQHPLLAHSCLSCGRSFALPQALGRHTRHCVPSSKTAVQPDPLLQHPCPDCNFRAPYKSELIYHQLHHTYGALSKNQLIDCPLCTKKFSKHSLRCHLRQHTDEKIFACDICQRKFSRRHNLKDHMSKIHLGGNEARNKSKTIT